MTAHAFTLEIEQPRTLDGGLLVGIRCTSCDDVHRLVLAGEQLDAISVVFEATIARRRPDVRSLVSPELVTAAADVIAALVWQLTHATTHREQHARDAAGACRDCDKGRCVSCSQSTTSGIYVRRRIGGVPGSHLICRACFSQLGGVS